MEVTGQRDKFPIPSAQYFEELYDMMGEEHVKILFADYEGQPIAVTYNFLYGDKVWYMFGGSLNEKRNLMPTYLLQWENIKWAKENNCNVYDFRGICAVDLEHRNEGLYRFKKGFKPDLIEFTEIYKVYNPFMYFAFKKLFLCHLLLGMWRTKATCRTGGCICARRNATAVFRALSWW